VRPTVPSNFSNILTPARETPSPCVAASLRGLPAIASFSQSLQILPRSATHRMPDRAPGKPGERRVVRTPAENSAPPLSAGPLARLPPPCKTAKDIRLSRSPSSCRLETRRERLAVRPFDRRALCAQLAPGFSGAQSAPLALLLRFHLCIRRPR